MIPLSKDQLKLLLDGALGVLEKKFAGRVIITLVLTTVQTAIDNPETLNLIYSELVALKIIAPA